MAGAVKGLDKLLKQLKALPKAQVKAAQDSLAQGGKEVSEAIKRAAPVLKGSRKNRRAGALRDSVGWTFGDPPKTKATGALRASSSDSGKFNRAKAEQDEALKEAGLKVSVYAGGDEAFYARWVEFGRAAHAGEAPRQNRNYRRTEVLTKGKRAVPSAPAQPFFYPTVRALKKRVKSRLVRNANRAAKAAAALKES